MFVLAQKSDLLLAVNKTVDMSVAEGATVSPLVRKLGSLAQVSYLRGRICIESNLTTGTATVAVRAGGVELTSISIGSNGYFEKDVDLSAVRGAQDVQVTTTCNSIGENFDLNAWLEIEQPAIVNA